MDFFGTIKAAVEATGAGGLLETLPPSRWDKASINGHQKATVTAHGVGLADGAAWTFFTFKDDAGGALHTIWGEEDASGHTTISLADGEHDPADKGAEVENARIVLQPIIQVFSIKTSVRFKFRDVSGQQQEYRFDGRSWP